jgi:hypothetical protein
MGLHLYLYPFLFPGRLHCPMAMQSVYYLFQMRRSVLGVAGLALPRLCPIDTAFRPLFAYAHHNFARR